MSWNTHIPKFRRFVLQNFPFIEEDFDALTDYALICKVVEYLNKVINSQNQLISEVESFETGMTADFNNLSDAFDQLQSFVDHYFDNLDVQQEINNKLDQMVEDGTLQEIIASYLNANAMWCFDTVNDMVNAPNLINGSFARTIGYHAKNDGGAGVYKIRTITNDDVVDGGSIIEMADNSLIAELIVGDRLVPEQFGAYGDGTHDDLQYLVACRNYCTAHHILMAGLQSSTYGVSDGFDLTTGCSYDFGLATFKALNAMTYVIRHRKTAEAHVEPINNETTKNMVIDCDNKASYGFYQDIFGWSVVVDNIRVLNPSQIGIYIKTGQVRLMNCKVEQMDTTVSCIGVQVDSGDSEYYNIVTRDCTTGIKINAQANTFNECHPVMFNATIEGSTGFEISQQTSLINCFADTFMYGIKITREIVDVNIINFKNAINTDYYNTTTASQAPYVIYFTSDNVNWSSHITFVGTFCNTGVVWNNEYTKFSNISKWNGSSLLLNNSMLNQTNLLPNVPKEIRQLQQNVNISSLLHGVTADNANITMNGNNCYLRLENLVLPEINANTTYDIVEAANPIATRLIPDSTIQYGCTTLNGIYGRIVIYNTGRIGFYPYANVTDGDKLYIYLPYMK